jgi:alpha-1,6-mannosyltransferase
MGRLAFIAVVGALALNSAATVLLMRVSIANYPGGHALARLNEKTVESPHGKSTTSLSVPTRRAG